MKLLSLNADNGKAPQGTAARYLFAVLAVAAGLGLRMGVQAWVGPGLPAYITFYPAVIATALLGGLGPGLLATALTAVVVDVWILPPIGQFAVLSPVDRLALALFGCMGLFISAVAELYRRNRQKAAAYDREQALRETRAEREFLANFLENAAQPFAVGYPDGRIGRINRAYEHLTGYTAAELRAVDWSAVLTPPEWHEVERQKLEELNRTGQPVRYEKEYIRKDGSRVPIELFVHVVRGAQGKPDYYFTFLTDITARKQAEAALRESEDRYRTLVQNANSAIIRWKRDGTITFFNEFAQRLFGYPAPEIIGKHVGIIVPPQESSGRELSGLLQDIVVHPDRYVNNINENICRDGRRVWMAWTNKPILNDQGEVTEILAIASDITERKQAEAALREANERYELVISGSEAGIWDWDVSNHKVNYSPRWKAMRGLAEHEVSDSEKEWSDRIHPDDAPRVMAAVQAHLEGKMPVFAEEYRVRRKDGSWMWVADRGLAGRDNDGRVIRMAGSETDITERKMAEETQRKLAEESLRMSEQEFRSLAEAMPQIVWATRPDGWNIYFNQQWADYTGMTMEESYGHGWNTPFHPDDKQRAWDAWQRATQHNERYSLECRLRRHDGVYRWWLIRGEPMRGANGEILKWFGTCTDIEDLKNAEAALERRVAERTAALQASEALYRGIGESIDYGVWVCAPDGRNTYASESFLKMVGITQEQCSNFGWGSVLHPDDTERTIAAWQECVRTGGKWDIEHRFRGVDGQWHHVLARGVPVKNDRGEITCWAGINLDISRLKQAEAAAAAAHQQLQSVIDNTTSMVYACDLEERFVLVNATLAALLKTTPAQMIGKRRHEFMPQADADAHEAADRQVIAAGRAVEFEEHSDLDGRSITWLSTKFPLRDAQGRIYAVAGIVTDITARKAAEAAARESEERLRLALRASRAGAWNWDIETGNLDWSPDLFQLFGLDPANSKASFESWRAAMHPADRQIAEERIAAALRDRVQLRSEYRIVLPTGGERWILAFGETAYDADGKPQRMMGLCLDITERKQAEAELERARTTLTEAQKIAHLGSFEYIAATQTTVWSEEEYRIYGLDPAGPSPAYEEMLAKCIHPDDAALVHKTFTAAMQSSGIYELEHRIVRPDGSVRWVYDRAQPHFDERGQLLCYVGATLEITERKQAEQRLAADVAALTRMHALSVRAVEGTGIEPLLQEVMDASVAIMGAEKGTLQLLEGDTLHIMAHHGHAKPFLDFFAAAENVASVCGEATRRGERVVVEDVEQSPLFAGTASLPVLRAAGVRAVQSTPLMTRDGRLLGILTTHWPAPHVPDEHGLWRLDLLCRQAADLIERRQTEAERQKFVSLADHSAEFIGMCDIAFKPFYVNEAGRRLVGLDSLEQACAVRVQDFFFPEDQAMITGEFFPKVLREGSGEVEVRFRNFKTGQALWMIYGVFQVKDEAGQVAGYATVSRDITERKQAEAALRQSREDLDRAQSVGQIGSWRLDTRKNVLTWSDENHRIFGVPKGTPLSYESFLAIVHPDDRVYVDTQWHAGLRGEPYDIEHRLLVDGQVKWVREKAYLDFDDEGQLLGGFGITQDITERKRMEDTLRFLAQCGTTGTDSGFFGELARYLAGALGMDFVCIDRLEQDNLAAQTLAMFDHGRFLDNVCYTLKDTPCGDVVGQRVCVFPQNVRAKFPKDDVLQQMGAESYLGVTLWSARGQPIGLIAVIGRKPLADTRLAEAILQVVATRAGAELERQQAEESLRESEQRIQMALEVGGSFTFTWERASDCVLRSTSCGPVLGVTGEEVEEDTGQRYFQRVHPEDRARFVEMLGQLKPGADTYRTEYRVVRGDGSTAVLEETGRAFFNTDGTLRRLLGVTTDITQRKQAEEALRASLAEKEVLLKEIHHRVKNNMQVLSSLVSLQADALADPVLAAAFTDVRDRVRSMALVHEKLYQSGTLAAVDFAAYAESLLSYLWDAHHTKAAVELKTELEPVTLTVETAVPCGLILNELAANALKHAFRGRTEGAVTVAVRAAADGRVTLSVSDNGAGLPAGFDWRGSKSLGLRLVQMLAKQLGGTAEARRSEAGGAEFEVVFPGGKR